MERRSASSVKVRKRYTNDAFEGIDELDDLRSEDGTAVDLATDSDDEALDRFDANDQSSDDDSSSDMQGIASEDESDGNEPAEDSTLEDLVPVLGRVDERPIKRAQSRSLASQRSSRRQPLAKTLHVRGKILLGIRWSACIPSSSTPLGYRYL